MWVLYHVLGQKSKEIEINVREMSISTEGKKTGDSV
jgi:hypothetical protein